MLNPSTLATHCIIPQKSTSGGFKIDKSKMDMSQPFSWHALRLHALHITKCGHLCHWRQLWTKQEQQERAVGWHGDIESSLLTQLPKTVFPLKWPGILLKLLHGEPFLFEKWRYSFAMWNRSSTISFMPKQTFAFVPSFLPSFLVFSLPFLWKKKSTRKKWSNFTPVKIWYVFSLFKTWLSSNKN